jgi:hypothetical protein
LAWWLSAWGAKGILAFAFCAFRVGGCGLHGIPVTYGVNKRALPNSEQNDDHHLDIMLVHI